MVVQLNMKFADAIPRFTEWRRYKIGKFTLKGYDQYLKRFCIFTRNPEIEQISVQDFVDWFGLMETVNYDSNSYIPMAQAIKEFFKFYHRLGYKVIDPELIPVPRKQFKMPKVATKEEYEALIRISYETVEAAPAARNRACLGLLWDTGCRIGELLSVNLSEVSLDKKSAIVRTEKSKGRRPIRELFWSERTNGFIVDWLREREGVAARRKIDPNALFISLKTVHYGKRMGNGGVWGFMDYYSDLAGLKRTVNPHSFRHHKGHDIINKGGSAADVYNILGHASITSSQIYVTMQDAELKARADKFLDHS